MLTFIGRSIFATLFLLTSCINSQKEIHSRGYEITGHVKNISTHRVYMSVMVLDTAGQPKWPTIDSAEYVNETFIFRRDTQLIEPAWAAGIFYVDSVTKKTSSLSFNNQYLSTKEKPSSYGNFILENAIIDIKGDAKDKNGLKLTGSKETDFLFKYSLMNPPDKVYKMSAKINSALQIFDTSLLIFCKKQKDSLLKNYKTNFKKIIKQHPGNFQALSNIWNNANYFTLDELQDLANIFDKELLELPTGKKPIEFIAHTKQLTTGSVFPDFGYMDTTGKKNSLQDVKGKNATLIVFWASWCGPCRQEIPELKSFYNTYYPKGISIVSISCDNDFEKWKEALVKEQMVWQNLSNLPGNYQDIFSKYNIKAIPFIFLLNGNNQILLSGNLMIEEIILRLKQEAISSI
ncbi:MAG: TlpA disulfide reductase family protein [Ginsengibacter sp.]